MKKLWSYLTLFCLFSSSMSYALIGEIFDTTRDVTVGAIDTASDIATGAVGTAGTVATGGRIKRREKKQEFPRRETENLKEEIETPEGESLEREYQNEYSRTGERNFR